MGKRGQRTSEGGEMKLFRLLMLIIAILLAAALFVGCAATSPWQREHLSKPAGGFGVGGGGCGCN